MWLLLTGGGGCYRRINTTRSAMIASQPRSLHRLPHPFVRAPISVHAPSTTPLPSGQPSSIPGVVSCVAVLLQIAQGLPACLLRFPLPAITDARSNASPNRSGSVSACAVERWSTVDLPIVETVSLLPRLSQPDHRYKDYVTVISQSGVLSYGHSDSSYFGAQERGSDTALSAVHKWKTIGTRYKRASS